MTGQEGRTTKERVLDAVFALVVRGGLSEASLRKVAEESGVNIGSVRHCFSSHTGLMAAAADEVGDRMERRLRPVLEQGAQLQGLRARRDFLEEIALALLPPDPEDRDELVVLCEFITAARIHPEFWPAAVRMGNDMRSVLSQALVLAGVEESELECERLVALIDGLTFELVYPHGSPDDGECGDVLRHHLTALVR